LDYEIFVDQATESWRESRQLILRGRCSYVRWTSPVACSSASRLASSSQGLMLVGGSKSSAIDSSIGGTGRRFPRSKGLSSGIRGHWIWRGLHRAWQPLPLQNFVLVCQPRLLRLNYLIKTPSALDKLLSELSSAGISDRPKYSDTGKLPYLNAVIKESMRCFPTPTWPIERKVPTRGVTIDGIFLPKGTSVGCQPSVVHQDQAVFGEHTERFNPDRWLNKSDAELRLMDRAHLRFGKGKRLCLGQHIAVLQMKKLIPMLFMRFNVWRRPIFVCWMCRG